MVRPAVNCKRVQRLMGIKALCRDTVPLRRGLVQWYPQGVSGIILPLRSGVFGVRSSP